MRSSASATSGDGKRPCSASTIVPVTASGYHVLKVDGYSRTKAVANGSYLKSGTFHAGGHRWHLLYYPNGCRRETADSISIYLSLEGRPDAPVKAEHRLSLLDRDGEPVPAFTKVSGIDEFTGKHPTWGYKCFVKRELLEQSRHLRDDSFSVRYDVTVVADFQTVVDTGLPIVAVPPADWPEHFGSLLQSGDGADVAFKVGRETFAAHRCVLTARSPVFRAELLGPMRESTTTGYIRIKDIQPDVFRALLHFVYTDSLPETTGEEGQDDDNDVAMCQHLLVAADRYGMERLKLICEDTLCRHVKVDTAVSTLVLADQHSCHGLKKACFEFIRSPKNLDPVMESDGFDYLVKRCPSLLRELMTKLAAHSCSRSKLHT